MKAVVRTKRPLRFGAIHSPSVLSVSSAVNSSGFGISSLKIGVAFSLLMGGRLNEIAASSLSNL